MVLNKFSRCSANVPILEGECFLVVVAVSAEDIQDDDFVAVVVVAVAVAVFIGVG